MSLSAWTTREKFFVEGRNVGLTHFIIPGFHGTRLYVLVRDRGDIRSGVFFLLELTRIGSRLRIILSAVHMAHDTTRGLYLAYIYGTLRTKHPTMPWALLGTTIMRRRIFPYFTRTRYRIASNTNNSTYDFGTFVLLQCLRQNDC